jgi:hypothetical protein
VNNKKITHGIRIISFMAANLIISLSLFIIAKQPLRIIADRGFEVTLVNALVYVATCNKANRIIGARVTLQKIKNTCDKDRNIINKL